MTKSARRRVLESVVAALFFATASAVANMPAGDAAAGQQESTSSAATTTKPTLDEARSRAALLHDAFHATLTTVHHEYYREDEGLTIPAVTLKTVFADLTERHHVQLHWLAVNAQAMNVDHQAKDDFDKQAVKALASGKPFHEAVSGNLYRRAAPITLTSDCLKCHLPNRTSTAARIAALVITQEVAAGNGK